MKLELNFLEPVGYVFTVDAADIDGPCMGVIRTNIGRAFVRINGFGYAAVY